MKKKIDLFWYWFIFVVAFVLCFFSINDKKVNAYHLNENGNLVSDNLVDWYNVKFVPNNATISKLDSNGNLIVNLSDLGNTSYTGTYFYLKDYLTFGETYTFSLTIYSSRNGWYRFGYSDNNQFCQTDIASNSSKNVSCTFIYSDSSDAIIIYVYSSGDINSPTDYFEVNNLMINNGDVPLSYEPYGTWYSESNLNIEKEISYEEGYNAGIVANNTAPSFYFDSVKALIDFRSPTGTIIPSEVDMTQYVTGYNSIINISEVLGHAYGSAFNSQYYWLMLKLVNPISLSDTLVFKFSDISNAPNFNTKIVITFSSSKSCYDIGNGGIVCPNYASFTYDELLQNNFTLKLEDYGELENVSDIDSIDIQLYYNGTRSFGLLTLEDETLTGDITSDYEIGYRVGFITGEESGIVKGENIGYDKGYNEGYRKASQVVKDPGNNTLVGMVSVLMGMPVNMLVSIYDFDFLGINLAEFFFSLITLLVSIWLIKKLL